MKDPLGHKFILVKLAILLALLVWLSLAAPALSLTAQQDNRQLSRQQEKPNPTIERRIALVIGNGTYSNAPPLKNPSNDATLVAATLKKLGFEVTLGTNRSQREMKQLIREFGQRLRAGGGVGLFYFAGHGVQSTGHNYLVPVDADIQNEADLEDVGVDVNYVLRLMDDAQNALNIVILDACRNNPFARSFRSAQSGLAQVKAPTGTLIAYATSPDSAAADGDSGNSPYTEELTKQMETPGVVLETMFRRVTEQVSSRTGGRQEPWVSDNHKGEFFFHKGTTTSPILSNTEPVKIDPAAVERELWETIRNSKDANDFKGYLQNYPNGTYAAIARAKISQIEDVESSYWEKIKNSIDPSDFKGYLDKYPKGQFVGLAERRMNSAQVFGRRSNDLDPAVKRNVLNNLPNPVVIFAGIESRQSAGKTVSRYTYTVTNWEDYPDEVFVASPSLPPCGLNTKASRTWLDFYDTTGKRLYGFCALDNLRGSGKVWFDLYADVVPPYGIYIELTDRKTGKKYKSNVAQTNEIRKRP